MRTGAQLGELAVIARAEAPARIEGLSIAHGDVGVPRVRSQRVQIPIKRAPIAGVPRVEGGVSDPGVAAVRAARHTVFVRAPVTVFVHVVTAVGAVGGRRRNAGVLGLTCHTSHAPGGCAGAHPTAGLPNDVVFVYGLVTVAVEAITEIHGVYRRPGHTGVHHPTGAARERPLGGAAPHPAGGGGRHVALVHGAVAVRIATIAGVGPRIGCAGGARVHHRVLDAFAQTVRRANAEATGRGLDPVVFVGPAVAVGVGAVADITAGIGPPWFAAVLLFAVDAADPSIGQTLSEPAR